MTIIMFEQNDKNTDKKIEDLSKRMNIYSLGILVLDILNKNNKMINNNFIELLTDCLLNAFIINSSVFIIEKDIDYIINKYKILLWDNSS